MAISKLHTHTIFNPPSKKIPPNNTHTHALSELCVGSFCNPRTTERLRTQHTHVVTLLKPYIPEAVTHKTSNDPTSSAKPANARRIRGRENHTDSGVRNAMEQVVGGEERENGREEREKERETTATSRENPHTHSHTKDNNNEGVEGGFFPTGATKTFPLVVLVTFL